MFLIFQFRNNSQNKSYIDKYPVIEIHTLIKNL
jgi:hypothetical protein